MKKTLIVAAVSSWFAIAAQAQSSVTLYGVVDAGLTYTSNVRGNGNWQQTSGNLSQSRWGLKGSENLGGGLKAVFQLESGFNLGNGTYANNGSEFNRQAFVGLSSNYGTVTLGRQYDAVQDYLAPLTATGSWGGTAFAHLGNLDNLSTNGGFSTNNTIKFASADYAGLTFGGTYGFSNNAGQFATNRAYSLGAAYQWQGLHIGAAYGQQNKPGNSTSGAVTGATNIASGAYRQREFGVGADYAFGPAKVGLAWTQARADEVVTSSGSVRSNNYEVNGKYNLTPDLGLGVAYTFTDLRSDLNGADESARYHQIGTQADYSLSKRTDVYAQVVYQHASGGRNAYIYNPTSGGGASSSQNQTAATVGVRHSF